MKSTLLVLTLCALLTCPAFAQPADSTNAPSAGPSPGGHPAKLTDAEKQELRAAHDAAFQADPDLAAEGRDLMQKVEAYHMKLDAAMIKADPKVEPLIAKMKVSYEHRAGLDGQPTGQ